MYQDSNDLYLEYCDKEAVAKDVHSALVCMYADTNSIDYAYDELQKMVWLKDLYRDIARLNSYGREL